ncbi:MAG: ubiquinol-cytochrome c reductase iron-sulfur subunit [Pseudomonadota bacterium]
MSDTTHEPEGELPTRRDFIYVATGMFGVVGVGAVAWPFVASMAPDAAVLAAGQPVSLDVSSVEPGGTITVNWRGKPYFVRHLTEDEVATAAALGEGDMKDFAPMDARIGGPGDGAPAAGPGTANASWTVCAANCTHLGCVPSIVEDAPEGWFCPCHGSVFDMAGRILRGPAATNLPLPPYVFADDSTLIIGTDQA